jgi:hypothetical protein
MHVRRLTSCLDTDEAFEEEFAGKSAKSEGWHRIPLAQQPSVVLTERIKNELLPAEKIVSLEKHSERVAFESKRILAASSGTTAISEPSGSLTTT